MQISINNVGPIRNAVVELHPLTVFIGPNNAGKSVVATSIYAAMSRVGVGEVGFFGGIHDFYRDMDPQLAAEAEAYLSDAIGSKRYPAIEDLPEYLSKIFQESLDSAVQS